MKVANLCSNLHRGTFIPLLTRPYTALGAEEGIMRHMSLVDMGVVVPFLIAVALAPWWVATR